MTISTNHNETVLPVNPLAENTSTFTVVNSRADTLKAEVLGRLVGPGLAITASVVPKSKASQPDRYTLTHIPTGLAVVPRVCGTHVEQAATLALSFGVDWTIEDGKAVAEAVKVTGRQGELTLFHLACSDRWCVAGDGPKPESYSARCNTCDWQWDEEIEDDWPLDVDDAKRLANDHECEPYVQVFVPATSRWVAPYAVKAEAALGGEGNV